MNMINIDNDDDDDDIHLQIVGFLDLRGSGFWFDAEDVIESTILHMFLLHSSRCGTR